MQRPTNPAIVRAVSRLLGLPPDVLTTAMVTTSVAVAGEAGVVHTIKPLGVEGCVRGRDALARGLYQRLMAFVVAEVGGQREEGVVVGPVLLAGAAIGCLARR